MASKAQRLFEAVNGCLPPFPTASGGLPRQHCVAMRRAVEAGADPNAQQQDYGGTTPLSMAIQEGGNPRLIALLLELGADPNLADGDGWTPLALCRSMMRKPIDGDRYQQPTFSTTVEAAR